MSAKKDDNSLHVKSWMVTIDSGASANITRPDNIIGLLERNLSVPDFSDGSAGERESTADCRAEYTVHLNVDGRVTD
jgi:hypothetical protein